MKSVTMALCAAFSRLAGKVRDVNRVVYDITANPARYHRAGMIP